MVNLKNGVLNRKRQRGQALVETALFLPIFLVILAGVVEVSQYTATTNRISSAARASTRFASNGGEDEGMVTILLNSVTQTLNLEEDVWDVFSIRGTLNGDGSGFSDWEFTHIYGISQTQYITPLAQLDELRLQARILEDLQFDEDGNRIADLVNELADLRIVGTFVIHDIDSLLNLDATPGLTSIYSVSQFNVMRISGINVETSEGCAAFPIALGYGTRSLTPPTGGSNPFPTGFDYPIIAPEYFQYVRHQPNIGLDDNTNEGTVFRYFKGTTNLDFEWLVWNQQIFPTDVTLANSLKWPGNSLDYTNHGDAGIQPHPVYGYVVRGYAEPGNSPITDLHIDNLVAASGTQLSTDITLGIQNQSLNENISLGRDLRLIVFNELETGTSNYRIARFGIFKIRGYGNAGAADEWLLVEFIRWDDTCGQQITTP